MSNFIQNDVPKKLKPFSFHGVEFSDTSGNQARGDCPFCGKEQHFYVNCETGQWDCKVCGESGNVFTFLHKLHAAGRKRSGPGALFELASERGIPVKILSGYQVARSPLSNDWLVPCFNADGKLANLLKFSGGTLLSTPGCKQHLLRLPDYSDDGPLYVTEGPWDGMALHAVMTKLGKRTSIVSVPGAMNCHDQVVEIASGRDVILLFDNDEPGRKGMDKLIEKLGHRPQSIQTIRWPSDKRVGYDIRDFWIENKDDPDQALELLNTFLKGIEVDENDHFFAWGDTIEREDVQWLWLNRIPLGKLSIVSGDPGAGKSFLLLDVAARITSGKKFPDGSQAQMGRVLYLGEDAASDTLLPRFDAMGGDASRIGFLQKDQWFDLSGDDDLVQLDKFLHEHKDVRLVVLDTINDFIGKIDANKSNELRNTLRPLAKLAEKHGVAIVGINHLSKESRRAIHRTLGSVSFVGIARSVYQVSQDPKDRRRRLFLPVKNNLADADGLAFRITGDQTVEWETDPVTLHPDDVESGSSPSKSKKGVEWLRSFLEENGGSAPVKDIQQAAESEDFGWRTIESAKKALNVISDRKPSGWVWRLQSDEAEPKKAAS